MNSLNEGSQGVLEIRKVWGGPHPLEPRESRMFGVDRSA